LFEGQEIPVMSDVPIWKTHQDAGSVGVVDMPMSPAAVATMHDPLVVHAVECSESNHVTWKSVHDALPGEVLISTFPSIVDTAHQCAVGQETCEAMSPTLMFLIVHVDESLSGDVVDTELPWRSVATHSVDATHEIEPPVTKEPDGFSCEVHDGVDPNGDEE
jgi:hypothetical protein